MKIVVFILIALFSSVILNAQEKTKDTLYFKYDNKYDNKYINLYTEIPGHFYLDDSSGGSNGSFFFKKGEVKSDLSPKKILSLKKFIRSSDFYDKKKKLNNEKIAVFFSNYVVFLVKNIDKKVEYIQVESGFEIE
ncbi:hypothetical protein QWY99_18630 [Flavobacterium branchiarum]|uniref:Uncharacterized protein n=1 Tax=Flavobacterium branchiarum TaxID=1114870 RepID=A0ABV5FIJ7_9FLAO|nr:hypothetical protein [Flavobacterium branchiarum]MDN3675054.1 hypothetical protein [Flavobacterium branchiarum]